MKTLLLLPFIPESDAVENIFISEITSLIKTFNEIDLMMIKIKSQYGEPHNFIKSISQLNKLKYAIYKPSLLDKIKDFFNEWLIQNNLNKKNCLDLRIRVCKKKLLLNLKKLKKNDDKYDLVITHYEWMYKQEAFLNQISHKSILIKHDVNKHTNIHSLLKYSLVGFHSFNEYEMFKDRLNNSFFLPILTNFNNVIKSNIPKNIKTLGMIASSHTNNIHAAHNLVKIASLNPDYKFILAGSILKVLKIEHLPKNIILLKNVKKVDDFYNLIDATIHLYEHGTGVSMKAIESLLYNKIIFSTKKGVRGLINFGIENYIEINSLNKFRINSLKNNAIKGYISSNKKFISENYNQNKIDIRWSKIKNDLSKNNVS